MQATKSCKLALIVIAAAATILHSSCNCDGCDVVNETTGIKIEPVRDTVQLGSNTSQDVLYLRSVLAGHPGDRKCMRKDLVTCPASALDTKTIVLTSDRALVYANHTINAGENIWDDKEYIDIAVGENSGFSAYLATVKLNVNTAAGFQPGLYHFYYRAKAANNIEFRDTATICFY